MQRAELWEPVPGFEGLYEVSTHGRVRSLTVLREHGGYRPRVIPGRVLSTKRKSYHTATLWDAQGNAHPRKVHVLVATVFLSNPDGLPLVRHLDDDHHNNAVWNLAWGSYLDNAQDKVRNGIGGKKLTPNQVRDIKAALAAAPRTKAGGRFAPGVMSGLATQFGVSKVTIHSVATVRTTPCQQ